MRMRTGHDRGTRTSSRSDAGLCADAPIPGVRGGGPLAVAALRFAVWCVFSLAAMSPCAIAQAAEPEVAELSFDRRFENPTTFATVPKPAWITGVEQQGGAFVDDPRAWQVAATAPEGTGRLTITVDRGKVGADLAATILFGAEEVSDIAVQLFDAQGRAVVVDLFGNLVDVTKNFSTNTFVIPLRKYPTAEKIVLRRIRGPLSVYGVVLYPVVREGQPVDEELQKLARLLGDPLSPENPLVKSIQNIASSAKVDIASVPAAPSKSESTGTTAPVIPKVPAAVKPAEIRPFKRAIAILVEDSHGGSDIGNEYNFGSAELGRILTAQGAKVEGTRAAKGFSLAAGLTRAVLDPYGIVILNGRYAGRDLPYREAEILAIADWVRAGGSLLVTSPGREFGDGRQPACFNPVLKPFGIQFSDRDIDGTRLPTRVRDGHALVRGLAGFYVMNGVAVTGSSPADEIVWVERDCVMVAQRAGKGRVIAFGGGSAIMNQALNSKIIKHSAPRTVAANTDLLMNLALWLAGSETAR